MSVSKHSLTCVWGNFLHAFCSYGTGQAHRGDKDDCPQPQASSTFPVRYLQQLPNRRSCLELSRAFCRDSATPQLTQPHTAPSSRASACAHAGARSTGVGTAVAGADCREQTGLHHSSTTTACRFKLLLGSSWLISWGQVAHVSLFLCTCPSQVFLLLP